MRLNSGQDTGAATAKSGRRKLRPGEPSEWSQRPDDAAPPPHTRGSVQIQRRLDPTQAPSKPQLTTRRREHPSSKAVDTSAHGPPPATSAAAVAAAVAAGGRSNAAPWQPGLARVASETYRRPSTLHMDSYDGEDESANEQQPPRRTRRNSSPNYPRRRLMPGAYSEASTHRSPSVSSYGGNGDDGLEVEEVLPDAASRHSRRRVPSHDDYLDSSHDKDRFRKRFTPQRYYSDNEQDSDSPLSDSEAASSHTRESSRVRERSESRHKAQRYQLTHAIEGSRPEGSRPPPMSRERYDSSAISKYALDMSHVDTLSSNNKLARRTTSTGRDGVGYRSAGSAYEDREPLPRRSFTMRSARSLNGSTSGPARILGDVFGNTLSRPASPEKFFQLEKQTKLDKRKG